MADDCVALACFLLPCSLSGDILLRVNYAVSRQKKDVEKYGKVYQIAAPAFTLTKKFYFRDTQRAWALARHQHQHHSNAAAAAAAAVNNGNLVLPWGQSPMSSATNPQLLLQQQHQQQQQQEPFQQQQQQQTQPAENEHQQHQRSQQQPRQ